MQYIKSLFLYFEIGGKVIPVTILFRHDDDEAEFPFSGEVEELLSLHSGAIEGCFPVPPGKEKVKLSPEKERENLLLLEGGFPITGSTLTGTMQATASRCNYSVLFNGRSARMAGIDLTVRISTVASKRAKTLKSLGWTKAADAK